MFNIYILFLLLFAICAIFDYSNQKTFSIIIKEYLIFILIIFVGLRFNTGSDWAGYINYFDSVDIDTEKYETGFKILNIFIKSFFNNYYLLQLVASTFFIIAFCKFFYNFNKKYYFLSIYLAITLYFSGLFMAQVRQSIAVGILLIGSKYILERKPIRYFVSVFIASLFHSSAIMALFVYFIRCRVPKIINFLIILISLFLTRMPGVTISLLEKFVIFLPKNLQEFVIIYLNSQRFNMAGETASGLYFYSKILFALFILIFYQPKSIIDICSLNGLCVSVFITSLALGFSMVGRLEPYVGFFSIIGYTRFFEINDLKRNKSFYFICFLLFLIYFFIPFARERTSRARSKITGRIGNYSYLPYYNYLNYPAEAENRKDWME